MFVCLLLFMFCQMQTAKLRRDCFLFHLLVGMFTHEVFKNFTSVVSSHETDVVIAVNFPPQM